MRELSGVGHEDCAGLLRKYRRHDHARISHDRYAARLDLLSVPVALEEAQHMPAGASVKGHGKPSAAKQSPQGVEFLQ